MGDRRHDPEARRRAPVYARTGGDPARRVVTVCRSARLLGRLGVWGRGVPRWLFRAGTWTLVVVFSGRIVGDFRWFGIFKRVTGTPFAWWDTWVYVPLCALLALAVLVVAILEP